MSSNSYRDLRSWLLLKPFIPFVWEEKKPPTFSCLRDLHLCFLLRPRCDQTQFHFQSSLTSMALYKGLRKTPWKKAFKLLKYNALAFEPHDGGNMRVEAGQDFHPCVAIARVSYWCHGNTDLTSSAHKLK